MIPGRRSASKSATSCSRRARGQDPRCRAPSRRKRALGRRMGTFYAPCRPWPTQNISPTRSMVVPRRRSLATRSPPAWRTTSIPARASSRGLRVRRSPAGHRPARSRLQLGYISGSAFPESIAVVEALWRRRCLSTPHARMRRCTSPGEPSHICAAVFSIGAARKLPTAGCDLN